MSTVHERLKAKLAGARAGFGWKPKDGDNRIFILPPGSEFVSNLEAIETLAFQYRGHYFRIEGKPAEVSRCLDDLGEKCPACAMWRAYIKSPDPGLKELARQIGPSDQYVFNVLDINDLAKGVQRWGANWTCWSKIMEIASNPAWGIVYDPANGIVFMVTLTPGTKSRTGHNTYSVMPEPQRVSVLEILTAAPNGLQALDGLEEATMEVKPAEDILALLDEMGFPPLGGGVRAPVAVATTAGTPPVGVVTQPAAPRPVGVATPTAPAAVAAPVAPRPVAMATTPVAAAPVAPTAPGTVHYDPGPGYVEKVPVEQRPAGAPRCFGDYNPAVHRCAPCPVVTACQMRLLGVS